MLNLVDYPVTNAGRSQERRSERMQGGSEPRSWSAGYRVDLGRATMNLRPQGTELSSGDRRAISDPIARTENVTVRDCTSLPAPDTRPAACRRYPGLPLR